MFYRLPLSKQRSIRNSDDKDNLFDQLNQRLNASSFDTGSSDHEFVGEDYSRSNNQIQLSDYDD